jgi:acyl-CoA thioesterase-1
MLNCNALLLFSLAALGLQPSPYVSPAQENPILRALEPIEDVPGLPRVLLIGDSISMGYTIPVRELLKGKANVHHPPENCENTALGLKQLDSWLGPLKWDVIHFNFGLHDLKYQNEQGKNVDPELGHVVATLPVYEKNLRELVVRLKQTGARLIWCSTTPVPDGARNRVKGSEVAYNRVAEKVMNDNGISIDDLHAYAIRHQGEIQQPNNVHFTEEGSKQLAGLVAESILRQLWR